MANVFQRGNRWYLRVRDSSGKLIKKVSNARTKTEAVRLAGDLERKYERQRLGLEALPTADGGGTLGELMKWWLTEFSKGSPSHSVNEFVIEKHLLRSELADLPLAQVSAPRIEALLQTKGQEQLGPQSLNHLRGFLSRAFNAAKKVGRYAGPNPCVGVAKRRVPRGLPEYLRANEVPRVMAMLTSRWRPLFATAIYAGLRKGELLSLRKSDVDLEARLLSVARSGSRETTKGGHADAIPIASELVPYLEQALDASPSELMFPAEDSEGSRMRSDVKLASVLRRALGRAHIVTGWKHVCRKQGCKHSEKAASDEIRRCPVHDAKLWPKPIVRPIRFHDLRHYAEPLIMPTPRVMDRLRPSGAVVWLS